MVARNVLLSVGLLLLVGWVYTSFYFAMMDMAAYFLEGNRDYIFELNLIPFLIMALIVVIIYLINSSKRKGKPWAKMLLPDEFEEKDEREKQITATACRSAYVGMWYTFPFITALLLFYPFVQETIPYYPIFVFLLFPITQSLIYLISWKRNY